MEKTVKMRPGESGGLRQRGHWRGEERAGIRSEEIKRAERFEGHSASL